jgi:hypothetical protein
MQKRAIFLIKKISRRVTRVAWIDPPSFSAMVGQAIKDWINVGATVKLCLAVWKQENVIVTARPNKFDCATRNSE